MTWLKLDDKFARHRKVAPLSDAAFRLHVTALLHCAEQLTDGEITNADLKVMPSLPTGRRLVAALQELVDGGLWVVVDGGWALHDFADWNPSSAAIKAKQAAARERMQELRSRRVRANTERTEDEHDANETRSSRGVRSPRPVPSRPDQRSDLPEPPIQDLTGHRRAEPPERSVDEVQSTCPADLQLTDAQIATLAMGLGAPADRLRGLAAGLVARWCVDDARRMPRVRWQQRLASAVSSDWHRERTGKTPVAAPGRPADELSPEELARRQEAFRRAKAADEERGLAEMAALRAKLPPARTTGGVGTAAEAAAGLLADLEAARAKRAGASS